MSTNATHNPLQPTPTIRHRFHFLDALRGLAALLVVLWHMPSYLSSRGGHSSFLSVDFFFCLSGFVVAFSYERRLRDQLRIRDFFLTRIIRLYPIYFLGTVLGAIGALIAAGTFTSHSIDLPIFARSVLMLPNLNPARSVFLFPLDYATWSLFFELVANFAYGWCVRAGWASTRIVSAAALTSFFVLRLWMFSPRHFIDVGWSSVRADFFLGFARVALSFCLGVLALRLFERRILAPFTGRSGWTSALAIAAAVTFLLLTPRPGMRSTNFYLLTLAVAFPVLVYLGALVTIPTVWSTPCSFLGEISYPIYLLHLPFVTLLFLPSVASFLAGHSGARIPLLTATVLLITGLSFLASRLYDIPLRKLLIAKTNAAPQHTKTVALPLIQKHPTR